MTTKGEALDRFAQEIAKRHEEGKLEIGEDIEKLKADLAEGNCPICHKDVEEYTSKRNKTYVANKDHSPHTVRTKTDVVCVYNWDQFNEHVPPKEGEARSATTGEAANKPASSGFTPSDIPFIDETLNNFDKLISSAYLKCYEIASRGPGTTEKDKHITTCGFIHDFILYYTHNQKD